MRRVGSFLIMALIGGCAVATAPLRPVAVEGPIVPNPPAAHVERARSHPTPTRIDQKLDAVEKAVKDLHDELAR